MGRAGKGKRFATVGLLVTLAVLAAIGVGLDLSKPSRGVIDPLLEDGEAGTYVFFPEVLDPRRAT